MKTWTAAPKLTPALTISALWYRNDNYGGHDTQAFYLLKNNNNILMLYSRNLVLHFHNIEGLAIDIGIKFSPTSVHN